MTGKQTVLFFTVVKKWPPSQQGGSQKNQPYNQINTMYTPSYTSRQALPKFTASGSSSLRAPLGQVLTLDQIRNATPSVFAEQKHESRSERYTYIPTSVILERLANEGFRPVAAFQGGSRDEEKKGFTKHLIRLRHESLHLTTKDQIFSEIALLNSHDGTSSYRMMGGAFRLACLNGMVVSNGLLEEIRVPHKGDIAGQVIDGCIEILSKMPEVSDSVQEMENLQLSDAEQSIFANAALVVRYDDASLSPVTAPQILAPNRRDDSGADLWRTLNRVQENIIRGGVSYVQRNDLGQRMAIRRTRPINGIDQNTAVNRALWQLAEEMKALKA